MDDMAGVAAVVVAVVVVVVTESLRSFLRNRRRVVSSGSGVLPLCIDADFFVAFAVCSACVGDVDFVSLVSFASEFFLLVVLFGDSDAFRLLAIIDGFSKIFGTICGELPNFELFSASGLLNELNDRNSVLSVLSFGVGHAGTSLRQDDNELPKRLFSPLDFGDNGSLALVSVFIWNVDANGFVSPFLMLGGNRS